MSAGHRDPLDSDLFRVALQAAPCAMLLVDESGIIAFVNREAEKLFQYTQNELIGESIELLVPAGRRGVHRHRRIQYHAEPATRPMGMNRDLVALRKDGSEVQVEIGLNPVEVGGRRFVLSAVVDISERLLAHGFLAAQVKDVAQVRDELADLVAKDELTGLRNRRAFLDQLGIQIEMCARTTRPLSVLMLDVDHFKEYNDEFGHPAGDEVLRRVAAVLRAVARGSDFVARIGGEEFAIILPETGDQGALTFGERFRDMVASADWPLRPVTVSVGATTLKPSAPGTAEPAWRRALMADADKALYKSKRQGRNRVSYHPLASEN